MTLLGKPASEQLCICARTILSSVGGAARLGELYAVQPGSGKPGTVVPYECGDTQCYCVQAGSIDAANWGVVGQHGDGVWCLTCTSQQRYCVHVGVLVDASLVNASSAHSCLQPQAFERRLEEDFDRVEGKRRITCISQEQLPARTEDDPVLHSLIAGG